MKIPKVALLILLILAPLYGRIFHWLGHVWLTDPCYSHCLLVCSSPLSSPPCAEVVNEAPGTGPARRNPTAAHARALPRLVETRQNDGFPHRGLQTRPRRWVLNLSNMAEMGKAVYMYGVLLLIQDWVEHRACPSKKIPPRRT